MTFNFDWDYISAGAPLMTISNTSIAFNTPAINLLGRADRIKIGFDEAQMAIAAKACGDSESVKTYKFLDKEKNGWIRIGCKEFIRYLSEISGLQFSPARRFVAKYDYEGDFLYIIVEKNEQRKEVSL